MTFDSCARRASGSKKKRREETPTRRLRHRLLLRTIDARDGGGRLLGGIKLHESVPSRPPLTTGGNLHASNPGGVGEEVAKLLFGGAPRDVSDVQSRRRRVRRFVFGRHSFVRSFFFDWWFSVRARARVTDDDDDDDDGTASIHPSIPFRSIHPEHFTRRRRRCRRRRRRRSWGFESFCMVLIRVFWVV